MQIERAERKAQERETLIRNVAWNAMRYYVTRMTDPAEMEEADHLTSLLMAGEALLRHVNSHSSHPTHHLPSPMMWGWERETSPNSLEGASNPYQPVRVPYMKTPWRSQARPRRCLSARLRCNGSTG